VGSGAGGGKKEVIGSLSPKVSSFPQSPCDLSIRSARVPRIHFVGKRKRRRKRRVEGRKTGCFLSHFLFFPIQIPPTEV